MDDDDEDYDGNNSDTSVDDPCGFSKMQRLQDYKDGTAVPGIGHKSFFTPIRDTQNTPSSDILLPVPKDIGEQGIAKSSFDAKILLTKRNTEDKKSEEEIRKYEDGSLLVHQKHEFNAQNDTDGAAIDQGRSSTMKCTPEEDDDSKNKDLGAIRSSLTFMQAASAQSLNNNLFQETQSNSSINPTVSPHEYLARYYQIMQQHQQQAAAAAMNGATALSSRHHN